MKTLSLFPMKTAQPPLVGSTARTCTSMTVLFTVLTVMMEGRKTSCCPPAAARGGAIHSAPLENLGSAGCQPAIVGSLPALPRSPRRTKPAGDLLWVFFESTLHVPLDQQLSALQPLTK